MGSTVNYRQYFNPAQVNKIMQDLNAHATSVSSCACGSASYIEDNDKVENNIGTGYASGVSGTSGGDFNRWLDEQYENTFKKPDEQTRQGYLTPLKSELSEYNCSDEVYEKIITKLGEELDKYYSENGIKGLTNHLNQMLTDLVNQYNLKLPDIKIGILFGDEEKISPKYLIENIENYLNCGDPNVARFATKLDKLLTKYKLFNAYDQEDMFKCVIMLMNKSAGIENTHPVTLTRDTVAKLNEKGFFEELDKIVKSEDLKNEYYFGVDGYTDGFGQGGTGDCWLLSGIAALNASEAGRQILKDSISYEENGNIIVTFKGIGISYTITPEEMIEARMFSNGNNNPAYSHGDNDVQAMELATEKLRLELAAGNITLPYAGFVELPEDQLINMANGKILNGGGQSEILYYLTGNRPIFEFGAGLMNVEKDVLNWMYVGISNGTQAGFFSLGEDTEVTTVDDGTFSWKKSAPGEGHAFAIVGMTEDTITIVNPWYSDITYTLSWDVFVEMNPSNLGLTSINEEVISGTIDYDKEIVICGKTTTFNEIMSSEDFELEWGDYNIRGEDLLDAFLSCLDFNGGVLYRLEKTFDSYINKLNQAILKGKDLFYYKNWFTDENIKANVDYEISGISQDLEHINVKRLLEVFLSIINDVT